MEGDSCEPIAEGIHGEAHSRKPQRSGLVACKADAHINTTATPTVRGCDIHRGKVEGTVITQGGLGTFTRNRLTENHSAPLEHPRNVHPQETLEFAKLLT